MLDADQLYDRIGLALTSSANFFINYVVFQVCCCPLIQMSTCETRICVAIILVLVARRWSAYALIILHNHSFAWYMSKFCKALMPLEQLLTHL